LYFGKASRQEAHGADTYFSLVSEFDDSGHEVLEFGENVVVLFFSVKVGLFEGFEIDASEQGLEGVENDLREKNV
jgi:hypothetical protein